MLGMDQMYKMALDPRIYPDSRLLSIMQGKDQSLPMAIAMAAKQQRDKLTQASKGQQAEQGAKQPSVRDQMLARDLPPEHSGLAALPAENMQGMGEEKMMAGGGIVAFEDNQNQPVKLGMDGNTDEYPIFNVGDAISNVGSWMGKNWEKNKQIREGTYNAANPVSQATIANRDAYRSAPAVPAITPEMQAEIDKQSAATPVDKKPGGIGTPLSKGPAQAPQPPAPQDSGIAAAYKDFMGRKDPFAGLGDTDEQHAAKIAEAKNQGLSSFLMNMGAKIMSTTGPLGKAGGEGIAAGMPALENSHKVVRELDNNREQYKFNKAKADELRSQGNIEAAIKYENANTDLMYKSGSLAVEHEKNDMMRPYYAGLGSFYASGRGKNANELTLEQAGKQYKDLIKDKSEQRKLIAAGVTNASDYHRFINGGGIPLLNVSGTLPQGAPTLQLPS